MVKGLCTIATLAVAQASVLFDPDTHVASKSAGCGKSSPYAAGKTTSATGTYGGYTYTYRVYVPKGYNSNTPMPLVTQHHGWGMSAKSEERGSGITTYAEQDGYIAVYPQGANDNPNRGGPWYSWNAVGTTGSPGPEGSVCTSSASAPSYCYTGSCNCNDNPQCWWTTCQNEVTPTGTGKTNVNGFIPALYDTLESQLCIDTTREYVAGESNGGMMTYQVAVDMASRLAAAVPQFGSFHRGYSESPSSPVPILAFHGTQDTTVPANVSLSGDGYYYTTVDDIFNGDAYETGWRKANGCTGSTSHYPTKFDGQYQLYCVSTGSCTNGDVVRCSWNGGHNWYGNNPTSNGGLVSDFLMKWTKPTHLGYGRVQGEEPVEGDFLEDITILEDDSEEPNRFADLPETLTANAQGHYGNPTKGCQADENVIQLANGHACLPSVASGSSDENGVPVPKCKIGGAAPVEDNGCPNDALVNAGSKAFPICIGKGNSTDPYTNGEFHCVLVCPCNLDAEGQCDDQSHEHCPVDATCQLGELRNRGQGVCSYTGSSVTV
jgi:polyhydroxybutyrate depolymerase